MLRPYPAHFDAIRPVRFSRQQVFLRLAVIVLLTIVAGALFPWLLLLYFAIPIMVGLSLAQGGAHRARATERMIPALRLLIGFVAWLAFVTDRFPSKAPDETLRIDIAPRVDPTIGSALLRLITSIPFTLLALVLWVVGVIVGFVVSLFVLVRERFPLALYDLQRAIVRNSVRLIAYHASLTDQYPPFAFEMQPDLEPMVGA